MTKPHKALLSSTQRNSLGIDNQVYTQLLNKLEHKATPQEPGSKPLRLHTRLKYHQPYLELKLQTSDRMERVITVATRNISRGGLSVLHSSFIHQDTKVSVSLARVDAKPERVNGKVVRCDHRGGVVHEVGIQFEKEITVQEFIQPDIFDCLRTHELVNPAELQGKILVVGKDPVAIPLVREYLQHTSINFGFEESSEAALAKDLDSYDIIFSCLQLEPMSGPEFIRALRNAGYLKPVIINGFCKTHTVRSQIRLSTADLFVPCPIDENDFYCALAEFLITEWKHSTLLAMREHHSHNSAQVLRNEITRLGTTLAEASSAGDAVQIYAHCSKIRSIASLLGLVELSELAGQVGKQIESTGQPGPHEKDLLAIQNMCSDRAQAA